MKKLIAVLILAFVATCPIRLIAQSSLENDPAYLPIDKAFDFSTIKPEVNINLPKFLLKDVLADFDGGKNDPFAGTGINVSELIQDIKLIRVVIMKPNPTQGEAVAEGMTKLKSTLEAKWTAIAVVTEQKEKVGVYAMSDPSGESIAGLAVLIQDSGGEAIIANVVGRVSVGKLIKVASQMNKFPKDLLKKLTKAVETGGSEKSDPPAEKPAN
jgi:hypothetical protein